MNFAGERAKDKNSVSELTAAFVSIPRAVWGWAHRGVWAPGCQCGGEPRGTVQGRGDSSKQLLTTSADSKTRLTETLPCPGAAAAHCTTVARAPLGGALQGSAGWGTLTCFNARLTLELSFTSSWNSCSSLKQQLHMASHRGQRCFHRCCLYIHINCPCFRCLLVSMTTAKIKTPMSSFSLMMQVQLDLDLMWPKLRVCLPLQLLYWKIDVVKKKKIKKRWIELGNNYLHWEE